MDLSCKCLETFRGETSRCEFRAEGEDGLCNHCRSLTSLKKDFGWTQEQITEEVAWRVRRLQAPGVSMTHHRRNV